MRPKRIEGVHRRELPEDECILLEPGEALAVVLNPTAAAVWDLCDGARRLEEIAGTLAERFVEVGKARVHSDIEAVVRQLIESKLLVDVDTCGSGPS